MLLWIFNMGKIGNLCNVGRKNAFLGALMYYFMYKHSKIYIFKSVDG